MDRPKIGAPPAGDAGSATRELETPAPGAGDAGSAPREPKAPAPGAGNAKDATRERKPPAPGAGDTKDATRELKPPAPGAGNAKDATRELKPPAPGAGNAKDATREPETPAVEPETPAIAAPRGVEPVLWARLYQEARRRAERTEPAHDFSHVERVVTNALAIARAERADEAIAGTAALLHELFGLPKSHPDSSKAGDICAEHAHDLLVGERAARKFIDPVCAAIRDHAFSKGVVPDALESRVLQDADRLDALGAIGLARMWATCADMKRPFYDPSDPFAERRDPDDKQWGIDHVFKKLLVVPSRLHLATSRGMAEDRVVFIRAFVDQMRRELGR